VSAPGTDDHAVPPADNRASSRVVLLLVLATGAMDAACLLHLGVFTAYITASLVLAGANLVDTPGWPVPGLVAVVGFVAGAVAGGWLTRREVHRHRVARTVLLVDAACIAAGAVVAAWEGIDTRESRYVVIALLAIAMGCQTAAIRFVHVPEIPIAAATLATFGVVVGLTGEHGDRTAFLRRLGVVLAIVIGAILGAALARWEPWIAWATMAAFVAGIAVLAHRWLAPA
jgi:uncharacterized membrane protein YoaK (UPF0700 family)